MSSGRTKQLRIILVTGPAGAGRSTAINALEDIGVEAIDNLPLSLVPRLLEGPSLTRPLALGIDARNRQFSAQGLVELHARLAAHPDVYPELLFLDCTPEVLIRRYSETRRRHPLAPDESPGEGIARDIALLAPIRDRADILIDTSDLTPHDLRAEMQSLFGGGAADQLAVSLVSFSYKRGLPHGADMVLDCRFLNNPFWQADLRESTGLSPKVASYVAGDVRFIPFIQHVMSLAEFLLPAVKDEGKAHFSIAFGCTGGQHRSVAVAENVATGLAEHGWRVSIRHRELALAGRLATNAPLIVTKDRPL